MTASSSLANRVALISGAGSGIGAAIAMELARAGAHAVVQDINLDGAETVAREIRESGGSAEAAGGDLGQVATISTLVDSLMERHSRIDILVNNAGVQFVSPIEQFPLDQWNRLLAVLLTAPFLLTQAVLPAMRQHGWGRIINISSINGKRGDPGKAAYCSAKHGVIGLTRVAALETAADGITVNAICPGVVDTPLLRNQLGDLADVHGVSKEEALEHVYLKAIPQRRLLDPSEIATMVRFLATDEARGITGQAINVSAGFITH